MRHFFVLTTFWRHLWSITEKTHGNMESHCLTILVKFCCTLDWNWGLFYVTPSQPTYPTSFRLYFFSPSPMLCDWRLLLVFSVTPFKINQNKNQNRSTDKVQKLGNERRYICKDPRQDSGQRNISYTRYPKKHFTKIYRDLYGDAMLVLTWMSSNMVDGNQQKHLLPSFATKAWIYSSKNS